MSFTGNGAGALRRVLEDARRAEAAGDPAIWRIGRTGSFSRRSGGANPPPARSGSTAKSALSGAVVDLAQHIEAIAHRLLGEPNRMLSTRHQLRFGSRGSLVVEIDGPKRGAWFDHEGNEGGGPWQLLTVKGGIANGEVWKWLERELGIKPDRPEADGAGSRRIVATYDYRDERGSLLFQVVRFGPKDFRQRRPDGKGGWEWKTKGTRKILFRLPELFAAPADVVVYVPEGEKDVLAAVDLGLVATTNPGGAAKRGKDGRPGKSKWLREYTPYFAGRDAVMLPDNDDAGRDHAQAVARSLAPVARRVRVVELPGLPEKCDFSDWLAGGNTRARLEELVEQTPTWQPTGRMREAETEEAPVAEDQQEPRPIVKMFGGQLPQSIDVAEKVLAERDPEIFEFGSQPVYLGYEKPPKNHYAPYRRRTMFRYEPAHLADHWTRFVDFQKFDARSNRWRSADCPDKVASAYLQRRGRRHLRRLRAVISAPTLRPDSSVLDRPGYDEETGLYYDPCGVQYRPIPPKPSLGDAEQALQKLITPIALFPYVPDDPNKPAISASRSVTLSAMKTALIRTSLATAPLHSSSAPVAGSGKSMLDNIVAILATGRTCHPIAETTNTEEFEKRIATALIRGDQIIGLDNCVVPLGGGLLCQALTEERISIRDFGVLKDIDVENIALILANGNNLAFKGDVIRRSLRAVLDPKMERPELRRFDFSPIRIAVEQRPQLVVAALTALRAYHVAGRPSQDLAPLGSFEDWSDWVRSALVWLGQPDPCLTMAAARETDPELRQLRSLLNAWRSLFKTAVTAKRAIGEARLHTGDKELGAQRVALLEAIEAVAGERNDINPNRLGIWLGRHKGRVVDGLRFEEAGTNQGVALWLASRAEGGSEG